MWKPKITLRLAFVLFTVSLVGFSIVAKQEFDRRQAERISIERQQELEETRKNIANQRIAVGMLETDYLKIANPCEKRLFGPYTEYAHGFPGGLGHGLTVTVKNNHLVKAQSWSCLGGETYFNTMTKNEEMELDGLWSLANSH